jgi:hypothetical protein
LRILMVVNAFASSVTARNTVVIHRALSADNEVEIVETNRRGHAIRFAQDAARRGVDIVIGFGGDGTLNEVATGVAGTDTALAILPGGSTNVFARTLGMPNDPVPAVQLLARGIAVRDIRPIGLGHVNGRYFCFHTGIGYDAAVVREVERAAGVKRWLGHPLFIYASVRTWLSKYDRSHPHFSVRTSESPSPVDGYFTIVLNTNPYTYLGNRPLEMSPACHVGAGSRGDHVQDVEGRCGARSPRRRAARRRHDAIEDRRRADRSVVPHGVVVASISVPTRRRLSRGDVGAELRASTERGEARLSGIPLRRATRGDYRQRDVGNVGADAVDPPLDQLRHARQGRHTSTC